MARSGPLDCLKRRDLLNDPAKPKEKLLAAARTHLEAGLAYDAVDLFARAGEVKEVKDLAHKAAEEGDLFLFRHALKSIGEEATKETLLSLAEAAKKKGLDSFAASALELAGETIADDSNG